MWCRVLNALKFEDDGTRREPGAVVDIPEEIFATLPEGTVELTDAPVSVADVPPAPPPADAPEAPVTEPVAVVEPEPAAAVEAVPEEPPAPTVDTTAPVVEEPSAPVSTG